MFFENHIYGKTPGSDFKTLLNTSELIKLSEIEDKSIFFIPKETYSDEEKKNIYKYTYYALEKNNKFVLGKGIYDKKDESDRDKYLFHNLIFSLDEIKDTYFNPLKIIKQLDDLKTKDILDNKVSIKNEFSETLSNKNMKPMYITKYKDILKELIYLLFNKKNNKPLYLIGKPEDIFDFVEELFEILPTKVVKELSFNNLYYQDYTYFFIKGFLSEDLVKDLYSIKINLYTNESTSKINIESEKDLDYYNLISELALKNMNLLKELYQLEEEINNNKFDNLLNFLKKLEDFSENKFFHLKHINIIKNNIINGDIALISIIKDLLNTNELIELLKNKDVSKVMLNSPNISFLEIFIDILSKTNNDKDYFENIFIENTHYFEYLIRKVKSNESSKHIKILIQIINKINSKKEDYNELKIYIIKEILTDLKIYPEFNSHIKEITSFGNNKDFLLANFFINPEKIKIQKLFDKEKTFMYSLIINGISKKRIFEDNLDLNLLNNLVNKKDIPNIENFLINILFSNNNETIFKNKIFLELADKILELNNKKLQIFLSLLDYKNFDGFADFDILHDKLVLGYLEKGFICYLNKDFIEIKNFTKKNDFKLKKSKSSIFKRFYRFIFGGK